MPYVKNSSIAGVKDSFEIVAFNVDLRTKTILIEVNANVIGADGIARTDIKSLTLRNEDVLIVDPTWDTNSTPPKPAGFVLEDPNTWAGLSYEQIPKIIDQTRQFFDIAAEPTLYAMLKNNLYTNFATAGRLPPAIEGWSIV